MVGERKAAAEKRREAELLTEMELPKVPNSVNWVLLYNRQHANRFKNIMAGDLALHRFIARQCVHRRGQNAGVQLGYGTALYACAESYSLYDARYRISGYVPIDEKRGHRNKLGYSATKISLY